MLFFQRMICASAGAIVKQLLWISNTLMGQKNKEPDFSGSQWELSAHLRYCKLVCGATHKRRHRTAINNNVTLADTASPASHQSWWHGLKNAVIRWSKCYNHFGQTASVPVPTAWFHGQGSKRFAARRKIMFPKAPITVSTLSATPGNPDMCIQLIYSF